MKQRSDFISCSVRRFTDLLLVGLAQQTKAWRMTPAMRKRLSIRRRPRSKTLWVTLT